MRPITATEVKMRQKIAWKYIDEMQTHIHNIAATIMWEIFIKYIGRRKINLYVLKTFKTM
jgi:hypothetical protein